MTVVYYSRKFAPSESERGERMAKISLKAARVNAGYNLVEAAALLNISKTTLVKWEQCKTYPDAVAIENICRVYNVHYDDISFLRSSSLKANQN